MAVPKGKKSGIVPGRILLADDNPAALKSIRGLLDGYEDWEVCGEARDGAEAIALAASLSPDLVVLDLSMPHMNGIQAGAKIHSATPNIPLLLFTLHIVDARMEAQARAAGFMGATSKGSYDSIIHAIEALLSGKAWFPASTAAAAAEAAASTGSVGTPEQASEPVPQPVQESSEDVVPEDAASGTTEKGAAPNPEGSPAGGPDEILPSAVVPESA